MRTLGAALLLPVLALAVLVGAAGPAATTDAAPNKRPNVVVILADDVALMDFGAYGGEARTPNIDALAARGALLAVATGKSRLGLNRALGHSGLGAYFHATRCADECFSKPHPAMLEELMGELGARPERTLMIGDTTHDLQMARNAGTAGVAVSFGAHPVAALEAEGPLACMHTPGALARWLRENA